MAGVPHRDWLRIKVGIDPARPEFWAQAHAGMRLDNAGSAPLAILGAQLLGGNDQPVVSQGSERLPATLTPDGALLSGRLEPDRSQPSTREPEPRSWTWDGADALCALTVLQPGASLAVHGPVQVTTALGRRLRAVVRWLPLGGDGADAVPLLTVVSAVVEPGAARVVTARIQYAAGLDPAVPAAPVLLAERDPLPAFALSAADQVRLLADAHEASANLVFEVDSLPQTLDDARKQAALAGGPAAWFAEQGAWAIEARGETWLVTPDGIDKIRGRLVKVIEWLGRNESTELMLFSLHAEPDPNGLVSYLESCGHTCHVATQRGGHRITVVVRADGLMKLVQDLAPKGLVVDGYTARRG